MYTFRESDDCLSYSILTGQNMSILSIPKSFDGYMRAISLAQTLLLLAVDIDDQLNPGKNGEMLYNNVNKLHAGVEEIELLLTGPDTADSAGVSEQPAYLMGDFSPA